jgi:Uma2 family endonuclease
VSLGDAATDVCYTTLMNAPLDLRMDKEEFLRWVQGRQGRFELERRRVMQQMTGGSRNHARLAARMIAAFSSQLDPNDWNICTTDLGVEIGDSVRFPDVLVERTGPDGNLCSSSEPTVLVEILSPSSVMRDLKTKLDEYTSLPSLHAYIVASQDEPIVWIWQRSPDGAFPDDPQELSGRTATLTIDHLGLTFDLVDLYRGIGQS